MFKNLTPYALPGAAQQINPQALPEQLAALPFHPCGPTEPERWGFVPPSLREHGELAERLGGGRIVVAVRRQQRKVPADALRKRVDEMAEQIAQDTGRKPGAKRRRELKEEALLELLPKAFTRDTTTHVLLDIEGRRLIVGSTTTALLDGALTALTKAVPGLAPQPLQTAESPAACMKAWLLDGVAPAGFGIGLAAELRSSDVQAATVRYTRHGLDGADMQQHLATGKEVRRLALNWKDRTDFVLTESLQLRGLAMDLAAEATGEEAGDEPWRADAELVTAELVLVLDALEEGLGGRMESVL